MGNANVAPKGVKVEEDILRELEANTYFTREELETLSTTFFSVATDVTEEGNKKEPRVAGVLVKGEVDLTDAEAGPSVLPHAPSVDFQTLDVLSKPTKHYRMTLEKFRTLFPPFGREVVDSLFTIMDENGDGTIEFREFAITLSIMSRGSLEDKILLSYQLCDFDRSGFVDREEMRKVLDQINRCIRVSTSQDAQTAAKVNMVAVLSTNDIINSLFSKRPSFTATLHDDDLSNASSSSASISSLSSSSSTVPPNPLPPDTVSDQKQRHQRRHSHRIHHLHRHQKRHKGERDRERERVNGDPKLSFTKFVQHLSPIYSPFPVLEGSEGGMRSQEYPKRRQRIRSRLRRGTVFCWEGIIKCKACKSPSIDDLEGLEIVENEDNEGDEIEGTEKGSLGFVPKFRDALRQHHQDLEDQWKRGEQEYLRTHGDGTTGKEEPSVGQTSVGKGSKKTTKATTSPPLDFTSGNAKAGDEGGEEVSTLELKSNVEARCASRNRATIRQILQEEMVREEKRGAEQREDKLLTEKEKGNENGEEEQPGVVKGLVEPQRQGPLEPWNPEATLSKWYTVVDRSMIEKRMSAGETQQSTLSSTSSSSSSSQDQRPEQSHQTSEEGLEEERLVMPEESKKDTYSPPLPHLEQVTPPSSPVQPSASSPPPLPPPLPPVAVPSVIRVYQPNHIDPRIKAAQLRIHNFQMKKSNEGVNHQPTIAARGPAPMEQQPRKRFLSQSQTIFVNPPPTPEPTSTLPEAQKKRLARARWATISQRLRGLKSMDLPTSSSAQPVVQRPAPLARTSTTVEKPVESTRTSGWSRVMDAIKRKGPASITPSHSHLAARQKVLDAIKTRRKPELLDQLSMRQFVVRTISDSELIAGFDILFEFFSKHLLDPVINDPYYQLASSYIISTASGTYSELAKFPSMFGKMKKEKASRLHVSRYYAVTCVVKHGFFAYYRDGQRSPRKVLTLQDASVRAIEAKKEGGETENQLFLGVLNYHRKFNLNDSSALKEWKKVLRLNTALRKPQFHRFHSFAPVRSRTTARWFVDGKDYFQDLALDGLANAKKCIYIADWWLVPELQLVRCPEQSDNPFPVEYRLESILKRKADEGVKINILLWQETTVAGWNLASSIVKKRLEKLSDNIKVLLHPWVFPIKWSHHQKLVIIDHSIAYLGGIDLCFGRYDDSTHPLVDDQERLFPGRDYTNYQWNPDTYGDPRTQALDRQTQARMPWHDIQLRVEGSAAIDCSYNFIQRWNLAVRTSRNPGFVRSMSFPQLRDLYIFPDFPGAVEDKGSCDCQILRSVCYWSTGVYTESSIYKAYLDCIRKANHCVYIENQFFISRTTDDEEQVKNCIAKAILDRIALAIRREETFRVIIVLPISPGGLEDPATRYMLKLTFDSVSRGGRSLLEQISALTPRPFDYISFHCLRNWNVLSNGNLVSEQIYVHSKLMIVDDQIVISGSANINDRSMRGTRDSEICAIIEDRHYIDSMMNGKAHKAGAFAFNLRRKLWQQHLGLADDELDLIRDPNHVSVYRDLWQATSRHNTQILARVFPSSILNPKEHMREQHETGPIQTGEEEFTTKVAASSSIQSPSIVVETVEPNSLPLQTQTKFDGPEGKEVAAALAKEIIPDSSSSRRSLPSSSSSSSSPHASNLRELAHSIRNRLNSNSGGGPVNLEGERPEFGDGITPEAEKLLEMLAQLRGFLNDYPLDLFLDEDLDFGLGVESLVPKNVFL